VQERPLYGLIRKHRITSIVEVGIRDLATSQRLIRLARQGPGTAVRYTGVDLFDARPSEEPPLTLKQAHRTLSQSGAVVRLIPGDARTVLATHANQLVGTQLLLIRTNSDAQALGRAWYYVPRMLAPAGIVLLQMKNEAGHFLDMRRVPAEEIDRWVHAATRLERSAA
jgi:hypothetical protein